jgi:cytochrome c biogenesis protein CcdA
MNHKIILYSILTIIGFLVPNYIVFQTVLSTGTFDFLEFFRSFNYNYYTRFTAVDLGITGFTFLTYYFLEFKNLDLKQRYLPILGTFLVGLSFGFPLFLVLKEMSQNNYKNQTIN